MKHFEYFAEPTFTSVHPRWIPRISIVMLLAFMFTFCGCLSRPPMNEQTFSFNIPILATTNGEAGERVLGIRTLQIASPFDERALVYRTGEFSYQRNPYAEFLDSPSEGLIAPICGILRGDGCFSDVVLAGSVVKPDTLVEITINQLYGDIRKPQSPCAVLAIQVTFLDATNGMPGKIILQRDYSRRVPLESGTPAALMEGWNKALIEIFAEVATDFRRQEIEKKRPGIRSGESKRSPLILETNVLGRFAAGDVRQDSSKHYTSAVAMERWP
jgi:cholesterol transport system auxiliary component